MRKTNKKFKECKLFARDNLREKSTVCMVKKKSEPDLLNCSD